MPPPQSLGLVPLGTSRDEVNITAEVALDHFFARLGMHRPVRALFLQALASVRPPEVKKVETKVEEVKPPSPIRPKVETREVSGGCRFMYSCWSL